MTVAYFFSKQIETYITTPLYKQHMASLTFSLIGFHLTHFWILRRENSSSCLGMMEGFVDLLSLSSSHVKACFMPNEAFNNAGENL